MPATITQKTYGDRHYGSAPPYGNLSKRRLKLTTSSTGAVTSADSTSAVANGDTVRVGILPAGLTLVDFVMTITTALTASVTAKIGFAYVDGVDVTAVPQDDDYFVAAGQSLASAAVVRKTTTTAPVTLPKDAYLTVTTAGADNAKASEVHFVVIGELLGPK